jgi:OOP family OmpA-OmpF porin
MRTLTACTLLAACVVACGGGARQSAEAQAAPSGPGWPDLGRGYARFIRIDLGPDAFDECRRVTPKFPFDSAVTYAQDREQLGAFAACLNTPGMKERTVQLVGRADPQGTEAYNEELGRKRADAIRQLLIENGITNDRIELATEGAKGAKGDSPDYSLGYDRRVDVVVKGGRHSP